MLQRGQQTGNVPRARGAPPGPPQGLKAQPRWSTPLGPWWVHQDPRPPPCPAPPPSCAEPYVVPLSCLLLLRAMAVHTMAGEALPGPCGPCLRWRVRAGYDGFGSGDVPHRCHLCGAQPEATAAPGAPWAVWNIVLPWGQEGCTWQWPTWHSCEMQSIAWPAGMQLHQPYSHGLEKADLREEQPESIPRL